MILGHPFWLLLTYEAEQQDQFVFTTAFKEKQAGPRRQLWPHETPSLLAVLEQPLLKANSLKTSAETSNPATSKQASKHS